MKNVPVSGSFTRASRKLFYTLEYNKEAVVVNLSNPSKKCKLLIFCDFETKANRPLLPNENSRYKFEEKKGGEFLSIVVPKDVEVEEGAKLVFGV